MAEKAELPADVTGDRIPLSVIHNAAPGNRSLRGLAFMPPRAKAKAFFSTVTGHRAVRMEPCPRVPARRSRINFKLGAEHCPNPPAKWLFRNHWESPGKAFRLHPKGAKLASQNNGRGMAFGTRKLFLSARP